MCPISAPAELIASVRKKQQTTSLGGGDKNISKNFILCPEGPAVFYFHKVNIERGKHLATMSVLSPVCGHNASFALTSACGHVAVFAQLIMHVDHCVLFAQDGAEMKVWEVRWKDSFDI